MERTSLDVLNSTALASNIRVPLQGRPDPNEWKREVDLTERLHGPDVTVELSPALLQQRPLPWPSLFVFHKVLFLPLSLSDHNGGRHTVLLTTIVEDKPSELGNETSSSQSKPEYSSSVSSTT